MTNSQGGRRHSIQTIQSSKLFCVTALLSAFLIASTSARAFQFDVFLGYGNDGVVREANWFPVTCEIHNDGPAFTGVVELGTSNSGSDNVRRFVVELPTETRKRIVIPVFAAGSRFQTWKARLLDERGRVVAEQEDIRAGVGMTWSAPLMGALPGLSPPARDSRWRQRCQTQDCPISRAPRSGQPHRSRGHGRLLPEL
jgi:hypothetical protein